MKEASRFMGLMFALALSVMALGATVANAEPQSVWKISNTKNTDTLKPNVQVVELETLGVTGVKEGILLTKVGLTAVEILCTEMKLIDALLGLSGSATGKIHFEGCIAKLNKGAAAGACKPHSPGATEGLIETNALKGLIVLHTTSGGTKEELLELTPASGTVFVDVKMGKEVGSECIIGSHFEIAGKFFAKAGTTTELKTETREKLFSEGPLSALLFGGNAATIDGSVKTALGEAHVNMNWSGLAG